MCASGVIVRMWDSKGIGEAGGEGLFRVGFPWWHNNRQMRALSLLLLLTNQHLETLLSFALIFPFLLMLLTNANIAH